MQVGDEKPDHGADEGARDDAGPVHFHPPGDRRGEGKNRGLRGKARPRVWIAPLPAVIDVQTANGAGGSS